MTDEVFDRLHERTEGWPVGLRLTALALRESEDRLAFAQRVANSSHRPVMDYLLDEELYELLLRASVLDRFCRGDKQDGTYGIHPRHAFPRRYRPHG